MTAFSQEFVSAASIPIVAAELNYNFLALLRVILLFECVLRAIPCARIRQRSKRRFQVRQPCKDAVIFMVWKMFVEIRLIEEPTIYLDKATTAQNTLIFLLGDIIELQCSVDFDSLPAN